MQIKSNWFPILLVAIITLVIANALWEHFDQPEKKISTSDASCWTGAGINQIPIDTVGEQIRYGRKLIENTAYYLGPKGTVAHISNGMNCQNCHLDAGTKPWGNNYGAVAANYPKYRDRSGHIESIEKRVNDCLERSLNGHAIDILSKEMRAIVAYIKWLGNEIPKGTKPKGSGIMDLSYLARAADPAKGQLVYITNCEKCHLKNGEGQIKPDQSGYTYPPLWGEHSYNTGAGLFRLSRLAGYVKNNMPNPVTYHNPQLTDEQAWDVAAFINSQPRPTKDLTNDWPILKTKPFDHPFGPYADGFSEEQHKYGPFEEIIQKSKLKSQK